MLDPGRYFAEAIYFLQYTLAQILWAIDRAALSIAVIADSINSWVTANIGYFVQLLVNALSAPLGGLFILALTALGFWYALNNIVPTGRWVDPSKLFTYGLIAFFFFSSPLIVIDMMEDLRQSLNAGVDQSLIDGAAGDIFDTSMNGTDTGLPAAIPDVDGDGLVGSFDLVAAFMAVANLNELDSSEFPVDFEAAYFPFGDPAGIDLSDEADQELAKALASDGIERLLFALVAIPTAVAEHFLRLALTAVAMFLYAGVPFAMLFAFFVYTQAFLAAYLRQFINLLIETFLSVIIAAIMIGLLAAAAQQGIGLYIAASVLTLLVLLWRIKSALKLASAAFNLFGGGMLTGGAGGMEIATMGKQAVLGAASMAGAVLTGGATLAVGGAALAGAAALRIDEARDGVYLGADPEKTDGRVRQLKAMAGYALGKNEAARHVIEGTHEVRTLARNFRDGEVQSHNPDLLDYLRAGSSMSGFGSSPWLAMRLSPSLRAAYDQIGGGSGRGQNGDLWSEAYDENGELVRQNGHLVANGRLRAYRHQEPQNGLDEAGANDQEDAAWRSEPATSRQLNYLRRLGTTVADDLTRGEASDLIAQAKRPQWRRELETDPGQTGASRPASQELLHHFANLEQAVTALTAALASPGTMSQVAGSGQARVGRTARESANGPIPDWLREEVTEGAGGWTQGGGAEANQSHSRTVGNRGEAGSTGRTAPDPIHPDRTDAEAVPNRSQSPVVRLEELDESRQQAMATTLDRLEQPDSLAGQAAYKTLVAFTGERNAGLVKEAVGQHTAATVQEAANATAEVVAGYRAQGADDAGILAAFQSGEATATLREAHETGLSDEQLAAVADMVLLPQRELTRPELLAVIGEQAAAGPTTNPGDAGVAQAIGMPTGFGGQTGTIRSVIAGARAMNLSPADLTHLAELIRDGLHETAQAELVDRGHQPALTREFLSDVAALPAVLVVPQTTATKSPPPHQGETDA
jgi:hypothetical protein